MAHISVSEAISMVQIVLSSLRQMQINHKNVQDEVEDLSVCLHRVDAYLADMDGHEDTEQLKERVKQIRDVAYHIEDVLEEFMFYVPNRFHRFSISHKYDELAYAFKLWNPLSSAHKLVSDITDVKRRIENIVNLDRLGVTSGGNRMEEGSTSGSQSYHQVAHYIPGDEEIVGFEALILQLTDQVSSTHQVSGNITISVVGPGGSGKTAIVRKVYESKIIKRQFDCRAWVQVSRSFNFEELISRMLEQFCESGEEPSPSVETNTQAKLCRYLQRKRYVVVLDDIWKKEHWESIHKVLHPGSSGSRIIVTTRNSDLASSCAESDHFIHNLPALPGPVAWDLFCKKAFKTAEGQCPPELEDWSQKIVKRCEGLPLAIVAVEGDPIDCGTLVRLWLAEGFVSCKGGETKEEVAEYYLNELIERNLVHATKLDFDGQARDCRVLNVVRECIIQKSEEEGQCFRFSARRYTLCLQICEVLDLRDAPLDKFPEVIVLLNLLRYLCLRNTKIKEIPNSIKKLSYLETLDLKHTRVTTLPKGILQLCNLRHLLIYWYRIMKYATWDYEVGVKIASGISGLTHLQKLSLIKSDKHHKILKELEDLTQLRKLGLVDLKREGGKCLCASIEKMLHLSTLDVSSTNKDESLDLDYMQSPPPHLQRLYLKGHLRQFPGWISKLDNLLRIRLKWSRLQNSPLDALQELPNLLELSMVDAFTGDMLVFEAGRFQKLKILHIEQFDQLDTVKVEDGAMPKLQKLSLCKCEKLEILSLGIHNLTKIEELLLMICPSSSPIDFKRIMKIVRWYATSISSNLLFFKPMGLGHWRIFLDSIALLNPPMSVTPPGISRK